MFPESFKELNFLLNENHQRNKDVEKVTQKEENSEINNDLSIFVSITNANTPYKITFEILIFLPQIYRMDNPVLWYIRTFT